MAAPTFTPQATVFHPTSNTAQASASAGKPIINVSANSNAFAPPAKLGSGILAAAATKVSTQQPLQKDDTIPAKTTLSGSGEKVVEEGEGEEQKTEEAVATEMVTAVGAQNEEVVAASG